MVEHDVSNLRKMKRCWMSLNAESHSEVIEVVEKPHYSRATVGAANSAEEAIEPFLHVSQVYLFPNNVLFTKFSP